MLRKVALRCGKKPVDPWEELLSAVIRVEDYRYAVLLGHSANMECSRHGASNGSSVIFVVQSFPPVELSSREIRTLGHPQSFV